MLSRVKPPPRLVEICAGVDELSITDALDAAAGVGKLARVSTTTLPARTERITTSSADMPYTAARPALKPSLSKVSTVPATPKVAFTTGMEVAPGDPGDGGGANEGGDAKQVPQTTRTFAPPGLSGPQVPLVPPTHARDAHASTWSPTR